VGLPVSAANRFRAERSTGEFELFSITSMSAKKVILGKLQASFALGLLLVSVSAPFMMVCYLLRGISALDIFLNIALLGIFSIVLMQVGIFLGSMNLSKAFFSILQVLFVMGQLYTSFMFLVAMKVDEIVGSGTFGGSGGMARLIMFCIISFYSLYVFLLAYLSSVMMLELPNKNKAAPVKLFILFASVVIPIALIFGTPLLPGGKSDSPGILVAYYFFIGLPAILSIMLVHGPMLPAHPAIHAAWRKAAFWKRPFRFIIYQGRGPNFMWFSTFMLVICFWSFYFVGTDSQQVEYYYFPLLCFVLFVWAVAGNFVGGVFNIAPSLLLSVIGCVVPSVIGLFCLMAKKEQAALLLCPISAPFFFENLDFLNGAFICAIVFWLAVFIYGAGSYAKQRILEESLCKKR
jgi:hypothetical protein